MSSKQSSSSPATLPAIILLMLLFFFVLNLVESFPTKETVDEFQKQAQLFSRIFPYGKELYFLGEKTMLSAYKSADGYKDFWDAIFKEPLKALSINFSVLFAGYLLIFGALLSLFIYSAYSLFFLVFLAGGFFLYKRREYFEDLLIKHRARSLNPLKHDDKLTHIITLFLKNPVPASILHHNPYEGGLLEHSLNVARRSARLAKEMRISMKEAFIAGLVHDIGKLKIYRKEKLSDKAPAPSPLEGKKEVKEGKDRYVWTALHVNQEVVNKLFLKELEAKLGMKFPNDPQILHIVKMADMQETEKELRTNVYNIKPFFIPVLKNLNYTGVKKEAWRKGNYLMVLAHAFNRKLTELMLEQDKTLPLSPEPDREGVHVVAYSVVKQLPLVKEINGVKADDLGLFDVKIGEVLYKAVYVFPASYAQDIPETQESVDFHARAKN